ncbi:MAG TPA: sensor histidine kinase [Burkholderiales bacterium]|jgi:signal transduction histidine kinase|nr:sensor histidine kinase [Burkholderiales bacterium]
MQGFLFALIAVGAFNTVIATLLTLVGYGGGFGENLVFSQCIGLTILLLIHVGWRALWQGAKPPTGPFIALIATAVVGGWLGGSFLASLLLGMAWTAGRNAWVALAVTVAAGVAGTWFFWSRHRAAEMERQRIEAQLKMLQAQIEPHFLFNTLANVDALIQTDPKRARAMLGHFNDYLRATLAATRRESNTLADEFALLRGYLEVQRMRMGERLRFSLELPEQLAQADLPPMLLQPIVENALKHGIEPKVEGGEVRVSAREAGDRLFLEVADTGLGSANGATGGTGVGLANVRERLAVAFPGAQFEAGPNPAGGYTVRLSIPR